MASFVAPDDGVFRGMFGGLDGNRLGDYTFSEMPSDRESQAPVTPLEHASEELHPEAAVPEIELVDAASAVFNAIPLPHLIEEEHIVAPSSFSGVGQGHLVCHINHDLHSTTEPPIQVLLGNLRTLDQVLFAIPDQAAPVVWLRFPCGRDFVGMLRKDHVEFGYSARSSENEDRDPISLQETLWMELRTDCNRAKITYGYEITASLFCYDHSRSVCSERYILQIIRDPAPPRTPRTASAQQAPRSRSKRGVSEVTQPVQSDSKRTERS